jgi:hypothetical protein
LTPAPSLYDQFLDLIPTAAPAPHRVPVENTLRIGDLHKLSAPDRRRRKERLKAQRNAHTVETLGASIESLTTMVDTLKDTVFNLSETVSDIRGSNSANRALTTMASFADTVATLTAAKNGTEASRVQPCINSMEETVIRIKASLKGLELMKIQHNPHNYAHSQATTIRELHKTVDRMLKTSADQAADNKRLVAELQAARAELAQTKHAWSAREMVVASMTKKMSDEYDAAVASRQSSTRSEAALASHVARLRKELNAAKKAHEESQAEWKKRETSLIADSERLAASLKASDKAFRNAIKTINLRDVAVEAAKVETVRLNNALKEASLKLKDRDATLLLKDEELAKIQGELSSLLREFGEESAEAAKLEADEKLAADEWVKVDKVVEADRAIKADEGFHLDEKIKADQQSKPNKAAKVGKQLEVDIDEQLKVDIDDQLKVLQVEETVMINSTAKAQEALDKPTPVAKDACAANFSQADLKNSPSGSLAFKLNEALADANARRIEHLKPRRDHKAEIDQELEVKTNLEAGRSD